MSSSETDQSPSTVILTAEGVVSDRRGMEGPAALSTAAFSDLDTALRDFAYSSNSLLAASSDLIGLVCAVQRIEDFGAVGTTRAEIGRAVIELKYAVVRLDYPPSVAENLCLLFAIVIDEFILTSKWGRDSGWENLTIVADLFGLRDGGDRFYEVADRALMQPRALREFIELIYIFLKLGYRGRFPPGDDFLRDRLIGRLETALEITEPMPFPSNYGRKPQVTRPIQSPKSALHKLTLTMVVMIAGFGLWATVNHLEAQSIAAKLALRSAEIPIGVGPVFVYSSETGTTERRSNE